MKKIVFAFCFLFSTSLFAQVDSSIRKISISVRAMDCEFICSSISYEGEDFYDAAKAKFRVGNPPVGVTLVQVDSVSLESLLYIERVLRYNTFSLEFNVWNRFNTVLRAAGESYLITQLDRVDRSDDAVFLSVRGIGRKKLRKERL